MLGFENMDAKITAEEVTNQAGIGVFHIKLILISGLVWMARGFDMVVIRFVTPLISCKWKLERLHGALLNTVTLISTMLGCLIFGLLSDRQGRRKAFLHSLYILVIFGVLSVTAINFSMFAIFRALAGFAVGGFYQTLVLCCELFPGGKRGRVVYTLSIFWILGVISMQLVLYGTLARGHSWKLFVVVGALPSFIAFCLFKFYPESFRYQVMKGKYSAANGILAEMLKGSSQIVTARQLQLSPMKSPTRSSSGFFPGLFFVKSSIYLWLMGLWTSICYWSLVYIATDMSIDVHHRQYVYPKLRSSSGDVTFLRRNINFMIDLDRSISCAKFINISEFLFLTWTTVLDFPAFLIYLILADWMDRKKLLVRSYVLSIIFFCTIMGVVWIDQHDNVYFHAVSYGARTLFLGQHDLLLLVVAETFPTSHRGTAVGLEVAMFHLGQLLSSYIGVVLYIPFTLFAYILLTFLCVMGARRLEETKGKEMKDIIEQSSDENVDDNELPVILRPTS